MLTWVTFSGELREELHSMIPSNHPVCQSPTWENITYLSTGEASSLVPSERASARHCVGNISMSKFSAEMRAILFTTSSLKEVNCVGCGEFVEVHCMQFRATCNFELCNRLLGCAAHLPFPSLGETLQSI